MRAVTGSILERGEAEPRNEQSDGSQPPRIEAVFLYHNRPRDRLLADVAARRAPDTGLLGLNHLSDLGIDASPRTPPGQLRRRGSLGRVARTARELRSPWTLGDPDVVCSFLVNLFPLAARIRGRPAVIAFNVTLCTDYVRSSRPRRRLTQASLRSAAAIICLASAQREQLLRQHRLEPERVHVVPLGVDERFYRPQKPPEDGYVLAVGADLARDYETFIHAIRGLDARTIIVTNKRTRSTLPPGEVDVRANVSPAELRGLYAGAACVVLPTRREGYPYGADCSGQTVLLDAMAMGRPVVASERATLSDYVRDGDTALIVPPEDSPALRSALERVLGDEPLARALGAAGRRTVEERFTTTHLAQRLAPIIRGAAR